MLSLKMVMRLNSFSCLAFGGLFTLQPNLVADFLGGSTPAPKLFLLIMGILLIVNGIHLFWAAKADLPPKMLILYFSVGDYIWVIGSVGLIGAGLWITTTLGVFAAIMVSIIVGFFGTIQLNSLRSN